MDRGKTAAQCHVVTDAGGMPLGLTLRGANRHDSRLLAPTLIAASSIRTGHRGRPRRRPGKLHTDNAHDHRRCRPECRAHAITPCIARRGVESSTYLGRHGWVVERTFAWPARYRRLNVRCEHRANLHLAFTTLACALLCLGQIRRFYRAFLVTQPYRTSSITIPPKMSLPILRLEGRSILVTGTRPCLPC